MAKSDIGTKGRTGEVSLMEPGGRDGSDLSKSNCARGRTVVGQAVSGSMPDAIGWSSTRPTAGKDPALERGELRGVMEGSG